MCKKNIKANSNFFLYYFRRKLPELRGSINTPGIEEAPKDVKAITENTNYLFALVFTVAFLYR